MMTKSITHINDEKLSEIRKQIQQLCFTHTIKAPKIILTANKSVIVKLHHLPIIGHAVIELSKGTIDLLSPEELKAVISHEIGHIKQGLWKIALLRYLSSIALFPNHYLTLCIDWPRKEIDADSFAIEVTKNAKSLKQALVKISTAQMSCSMLPHDNNHSINKESTVEVCRRIFSNNIKSIVISVNFFFGDGLLGYIHPCLSERLRAIDANNAQEK
jgi:Zn-dependent protease with chaperone function